MTDTTDLTHAALAWHIRLRGGGDADWAAFADWLAQDARHAGAYDAVEALDLDLDHALPDVTFASTLPIAGNDDAPSPRHPTRWRRVAGSGGALAAALALALFMGHGSSRYDVTTAPGETRVVQLDAGTQVALNGDTHMTFDRKDPRFARLDHGEALFSVQHDPQHPFTLELAQSRVVDIGTVFNVVSLPDQTRIAVAQGAVDYQPQDTTVPLHAGQQLQADPKGGAVEVSSTDPETVAGWRHRRLTYAGNTLAQVAQDLGRMLGTVIEVDGDIARQPVYGTIDAQDITKARLPLLASALNVRVVRKGKAWVLKSIHGHAH